MNISIIREVNGTKVRKPVVPMKDDAQTTGVIGYNATNDELERIDTIDIDSVEVADRLTVTGDTYLNHANIEHDAVVHGDLYVDGTTYTTNEESLDTTSDYVVLRKNQAGLGLAQQSGIVVHNYANNKSASLAVDKDGIFRISDNAAESTTTYTNKTLYKNVWYNGIDLTDPATVITDGVVVAQELDEFEDIVDYNDAFYHYDGVEWFTMTLDNNHLVTDAVVTDAATITALDALTKDKVIYYRTISYLVIDASTNEPILTRAEDADLDNMQILSWDEINQKAVGIPLPTVSGTYLKYKETSSGGVTTKEYDWSKPLEIDGVPEDMDILQYNDSTGNLQPIPRPTLNGQVLTYKETSGTTGAVYYKELPSNTIYDPSDMSVTTLPASATYTNENVKWNKDIDISSILAFENGTWYAYSSKDAGGWPITSWPTTITTKIVDDESIDAYWAEIDETGFTSLSESNISLEVYTTPSTPGTKTYEWSSNVVKKGTVANNRIAIYDDGEINTMAAPSNDKDALIARIDSITGNITYEWGIGGSGSGSGVSFKGTRAQYEVAKLIPVGSPGHIPDGSLVIITDESSYIEGEDR